MGPSKGKGLEHRRLRLDIPSCPILLSLARGRINRHANASFTLLRIVVIRTDLSLKVKETTGMGTGMQHRGKAFSALLGSLFLSVIVQAQIPTGRIIGTVRDDNESHLPGVSVEATSPTLVGKAYAVTDANGVYRLFALTPGAYKITYTLPGFETVIMDGILVKMEQTVKLDVFMKQGILEEEGTS